MSRARSRSRSLRFSSLLAAGIALGASAARADEHDPQEAGNPVRIAAYVLSPIGVAFDWLVMRPAHWLVNREPFRTIFGHDA
jgi:hypothetical protein